MLIFGVFSMHSEQNSNNNTPGLPTIHITVNTANQAHLNQQNDLKQQADHTSVQQTCIKTDTSTIETEPNVQQKLYEFYQQQSKATHNHSSNALAWCTNNKLKAVGCGLLLLYSYISYQIYQADVIINDNSSWSNWHTNSSLEDLFATPQDRLQADLLFAIQTRYVHPTNPTDFIYSIVQATNSLQAEISILQKQIVLYQQIETCQCLPLFFINTQDLMLLQEKMRKLAFIKHILASWCAHYKIDKNS